MNNREIKFRVWNKKTNKWVHGPTKEVNLFGEMILLGGFMKGISVEDLNDCVALQYTGLKDKTGREIYEGDILIYRLSYNEMMESSGENDIDEVIYIDGAFKLSNGDYLYELINIDNKLEEEIIGNIFENRELLKIKE